MKRRRQTRDSKAKAQQVHAANRALERFGIMFGPRSQREAIQQIQSNDAEFVCKTSGRVSVWIVDIQNIRLKVVYDKHRKTIVTILPGTAPHSPVFGQGE